MGADGGLPVREGYDIICVFTTHSSCHGRVGRGDRVVAGTAETQKVAGLAFSPGPARVPLPSWTPFWLVLKKRLLCPRLSQGQSQEPLLREGPGSG